MDRCGQFLQVAATAAKRRFGERAAVALEEKASFPSEHRWCAQVKVRGDVMLSRASASPEGASRLLANALVYDVAAGHAADRALMDSAALAGLG